MTIEEIEKIAEKEIGSMSTADPRRIVDTSTIGKEVIEMKKRKKHHSQLQNEKATGEILTIDGSPA